MKALIIRSVVEEPFCVTVPRCARGFFNGVIIMKRIDLAGQRFGRLEVLKYSHTDKGKKAHWYVKCDCRNERVVRCGSLRSGKTKSCGCLNKEGIIEEIINTA